MDDVLTWLLNYCCDHDIGVIYDNNLPPYAPSDSYCNPKLVIFNDNFYNDNEKPYMLAHEIGHIVCGNPEFFKTANLGIAKGEHFANKYAIKLLLMYCDEMDLQFNSYYDFAKVFAIPTRNYYLLEETVCNYEY